MPDETWKRTLLVCSRFSYKDAGYSILTDWGLLGSRPYIYAITDHKINTGVRGMHQVKKFLNLIDFTYTLFGLPFAYLGAILASRGVPSWSQLGWITLAMVGARTAALCLNRIIDRHLDRANPRTSNWILASGQLPLWPIWTAVFAGLGLLLISAAQLNSLCFKLAPLAVVVLWGYSYTKRFTWWCHLILGMAIGMGPVGAWIAITGSLDWQPFLLGLTVACWIAGFDIMYACQDIVFDRSRGLYSVPARFGEAGALRFSEGLHLLMVVCLILSGLGFHLGLWYYSGAAVTTAVLAYEHSIVRPGNLSRVHDASFRINRYVGLIIFATTLTDILT